MTQHMTADVDLLDALALAFVVRVQGTWTPEAREGFQAELASEGLTPDTEALDAVLERARQHFESGGAHLFLCLGRPCRKRQKFDASAEALERVETAHGLLLTTTECQGPCKHAPVATLRVGQRCDMFAEFIRDDDWGSVLDFAGRAASEGTLLVTPGEAQSFRFDPVHDHDTGSGLLQKLKFFLGHFQGDVVFLGHFQGDVESTDGGENFHKEAVGTWEVNGRFLGFRMAVTYPLPDGRKDIHTAFVMIGVNPDSGDFDARVYTDGGMVHDYHLEVDENTVTFSDRVETHHRVNLTRARKVFCPTPYGFDERLEFDRGTGEYELYYRIPMYRSER